MLSVRPPWRHAERPAPPPHCLPHKVRRRVHAATRHANTWACGCAAMRRPHRSMMGDLVGAAAPACMCTRDITWLAPLLGCNRYASVQLYLHGAGAEGGGCHEVLCWARVCRPWVGAAAWGLCGSGAALASERQSSMCRGAAAHQPDIVVHARMEPSSTAWSRCDTLRDSSPGAGSMGMRLRLERRWPAAGAQPAARCTASGNARRRC